MDNEQILNQRGGFATNTFLNQGLASIDKEQILKQRGGLLATSLQKNIGWGIYPNLGPQRWPGTDKEAGGGFL